MTITKVEIIDKKDNEEILVNAIYIHNEDNSFSLFIDENMRLRTKISEFVFVSETPIIKI